MSRAASLLLACLLLAVPASAAAATDGSGAGSAAAGSLVPQGSIRGLKVGMTYSQVRTKLGKPSTNRLTTHPILGPTRTLTYGQLTVTVDGRAGTSLVSAMMTVSRYDRTGAGLGVGSTEAQLRAGLKGLRCETDLGYRTCRLGILRPGRLVTDFSISGGGKVKRITLGRVVD